MVFSGRGLSTGQRRDQSATHTASTTRSAGYLVRSVVDVCTFIVDATPSSCWPRNPPTAPHYIYHTSLQAWCTKRRIYGFKGIYRRRTYLILHMLYSADYAMFGSYIRPAPAVTFLNETSVAEYN